MKIPALLFILHSLVQSLFSAPVEISPVGTQPQLAVSQSGLAHVVFGTRKDEAIYHASSSDTGKIFTPAVKIGSLPDLALGLGRGPRITVAGDSVLVTAISLKDGMIHLWRRDDKPRGLWKEEAPINDTTGSAKEGLHSMAANAAGKVAVVWLDLRSGKTEIWISVSENSGKEWGGNTLVYHSSDGTVCECCRPSVAVGEDGRIAVMWRNWLDGSRDMYVSESTGDGMGFTEAKKLGAGTWKLNGCPMDGGGIAFGKDGKIETAWRREKSSFISSPGTEEILVSTNAVRPFIVSTGDNSRVFYESNGNVLMRNGDDPLIVAENAAFPSAASIPGKGIVIVWESNKLDASGILADFIETQKSNP